MAFVTLINTKINHIDQNCSFHHFGITRKRVSISRGRYQIQNKIAIVGTVPDSLPQALLKAGELANNISVSKAREEHKQYISLLSRADGIDSIYQLSKRNDLPDSVFVEDPLIILTKKIAVCGKSGHVKRQGEEESIKEILKIHDMKIVNIHSRMDGGDILRARNYLFVGISKRTEIMAAEELRCIVKELSQDEDDNNIIIIDILVDEGLHLKSAITWVGETTQHAAGFFVVSDTIIGKRIIQEIENKTNQQWDIVWVNDDKQSNCANVLYIASEQNNSMLIMQQTCEQAVKKVKQKLTSIKKLQNCQLETLNMKELAKANGALTCCSLLLPCE